MQLSGREPVLLSSSSERAYMSYVDLTNPDLYEGDELAVPQQTLNIRRIRTINGRLFERVRLKNYNPFPVRVAVEFSLGADFADIFEVRGLIRSQHGHQRAAARPTAARSSSPTPGIDGIRLRTWSSSGPTRPRWRSAGRWSMPGSMVHLSGHQTQARSR